MVDGLPFFVDQKSDSVISDVAAPQGFLKVFLVNLESKVMSRNFT